MADTPDNLDTKLSVTDCDSHGRRESAQLFPALLLAGNATDIKPPGNRVTLFRKNLQVGRKPAAGATVEADCIVRDSLVSSAHCSISRQGDSYWLADLGSRNGTIVDGVRLSAPAKLRDGAIIFVGTQVAVFRLASQRELDAIEQDLNRPFGPVATTSPALATLCNTLRRLAPGDGEILLTGETGTGKEIYARAIAAASGRTGRFVAINCAALPPELVESELFGYARGAHSQARDAKKGLFEEANEGTVFLDELGDMPMHLQAKLLRFLQDREITPLGATRARRLNVRVIAATSQCSRPSGNTGVGLRLDLSARLGAEPLRLPPLRHRIEDIGVLAAHFLRDRFIPCQPMAFQALALYAWPGNIRELEKVVMSAAVLAEGAPCIAPEHLPASVAAMPEHLKYAPPGAIHRPPPSAAELEQLLRACKGNVLRASRQLDRKPTLIYRWCRRFGLDPASFRHRDD